MNKKQKQSMAEQLEEVPPRPTKLDTKQKERAAKRKQDREREDALFAVEHRRHSRTRFFVRSIEADPYARYEEFDRRTYKMLIKERVMLGLPIRVHTLYVDGDPVKQLTLLPSPAGFLPRAEAV